MYFYHLLHLNTLEVIDEVSQENKFTSCDFYCSGCCPSIWSPSVQKEIQEILGFIQKVDSEQLLSGQWEPTKVDRGGTIWVWKPGILPYDVMVFVCKASPYAGSQGSVVPHCYLGWHVLKNAPWPHCRGMETQKERGGTKVQEQSWEAKLNRQIHVTSWSSQGGGVGVKYGKTMPFHSDTNSCKEREFKVFISHNKTEVTAQMHNQATAAITGSTITE